MSILSIENLSYTYPGGQKAVLRSVSAEFEEGKMYAITGPSGSGKSTLLSLLAERGVSVVTNPVSNLKLGNGIAPVPKLLKAGVNVALGTDGAASNNALNLFRELSFVTLLHKGVTGDTTAVPAAEALKMATVNGAKALGLAGCGEIREGARADLTVLDIDKPWLRPRCDLLSSLVYCARGDEVTDVMADGRFLLRKGELTTIDRERVLFEVDRTCKRLGLLK